MARTSVSGKATPGRAIVACLLVLACWVLPAVRVIAAQHVVLQLGWIAEAEFGGYLQARETGQYARRDLDVDIRFGNPQINTLQLLLSGRADFIVATSFDALNAARQKVPVVVVAALFQRDPRVLIAHRGRGNDTLAAMRGKPIMVAALDRVTFWPYLRRKYGFTDDQLRPYMFSTAPFLADPGAIQQGYITDEPFALAQQGQDLTVIQLSDTGYNPYGQVLMTTRQWVEHSPGEVQRMVDATVRGWRDYLHGDPSPANRAIKAGNPQMPEAQIRYAIATMNSRGLLEGGDAASAGIGTMSNERWEAIYRQLSSLGVYPADLDYRSIYTLQFVNGLAGSHRGL